MKRFVVLCAIGASVVLGGSLAAAPARQVEKVPGEWMVKVDDASFMVAAADALPEGAFLHGSCEKGSAQINMEIGGKYFAEAVRNNTGIVLQYGDGQRSAPKPLQAFSIHFNERDLVWVPQFQAEASVLKEWSSLRRLELTIGVSGKGGKFDARRTFLLPDARRSELAEIASACNAKR